MQSLTFFHIKRLPRHLPPFQHGEPVYRRDGTDGVEPIRVCICLVSESECKDSENRANRQTYCQKRCNVSDVRFQFLFWHPLDMSDGRKKV